MNKNIIIGGLVVVVALIVLTRVGKPQSTPATTQGSVTGTKQVANNSTPQASLRPADKVEVVNFFGNQRCQSCQAVGDLTKKTLKERFAEELAEGTIVFREVNGELPENRDLVVKYQARGSSLFINAIRGEQEDIIEDVTVWSLIKDEQKYADYLETKINQLLGA